MDASVKLGKIWGIPIGLHTSWFLIFGLLAWSLATGYFTVEYPELGQAGHFGLALLTSLLFFGSVLAHELGHAALALRNRIPVRGITLFIFGGVAQIGEEPKSPGAEFRIAIAGPLVSLALAGLFELAFVLDRAVPYLGATTDYLARINLMLALFNLIPGFPLDGGRVLRAAVWKLSGSLQRATQFASISGRVIAFGFMAFGVYTMVNGQFIGGLWYVFIGWFLQNAASSAYAQVSLQESLRNVTVGQAMDRECEAVPALMPLSQLVEERVLAGGQRCFFVTVDGKLQGVLTVREITAVPQLKWGFTTAGQAMLPLARLEQVDPQADLLQALELMERKNIVQVPVVKNEELVGLLSRERVFRYLKMRAELGM